ncbi:MAG: hypothetical protein ACQEXV_02240 [Bacillota bacterium]
MDRALAQQCYYQHIVQHQRQSDVSVGIGTMRSEVPWVPWVPEAGEWCG